MPERTFHDAKLKPTDVVGCSYQSSHATIVLSQSFSTLTPCVDFSFNHVPLLGVSSLTSASTNMLAMSSHLRAMPEPSDSSTHGSDATSVVTSNRVTLLRTSMSIPVGRRVNLPKTAATNSFMDEMGTWPTIKLHPDDAAAYLTAEIYEWFRERGIDKEAEILQEEEVSALIAHLLSFL
jgi:hypothetical protein